MGHIDFSLSEPLVATLAIGVLQPLYLAVVTRIPQFKGRNASQFLASCIVTVVLWGLYLTLARHVTTEDVVIGGMILIAGGLAYLEVWALLSRGYTLGMLITILNAGRALNSAELAALYRGGEGLDWVMRHRVGGLITSKMLRQSGENLQLSSVPGLQVAWLYRICVAILGLRRTG